MHRPKPGHAGVQLQQEPCALESLIEHLMLFLFRSKHHRTRTGRKKEKKSSKISECIVV